MQTYDPRLVTVSVAGITLTQFAKGTFVTAGRDTEAYSDEVGVRGEVVRIASGDKRGSIKVTLMKASPSNDALSALALQDELAGTGVGAALVKDITGTSLHHSAEAWVQKVPDSEYSTEAGTVEWVIRCAELEHYVGGTVNVVAQ